MEILTALRKWFLIPPCEDCGEARVIHPLEKFLSWVESYSPHVSIRSVPSALRDASRRHTYAMRTVCFRFGKFYFDGKHTTDSRIHALFEGATTSSYVLVDWHFLGFHRCFFLVHKTNKTIVHAFRTMPHELLAYESPVQIDDKYASAQFLGAHGVPVPKTYNCKSHLELKELEPSSKQFWVTKPRRGTRGRHTTLHIDSKEQLKHAVRTALVITNEVVVQAEVPGVVHRITVVGRTHVFACRREYPFVVGDGVHTITELVSIENRSPLRDGTFFRKIPFGAYQRGVLEQRGYSESDVPELGKRVIVHDKNSRRNGTITEDMTPSMHESIIACMREAASVLQTPAVGFDVMLEDISKPLSSQVFEIIESNSVPYIDIHHFPYIGEKHNVAGLLFNLVHAQFDADAPAIASV
jgi:ATP-grasp domain